jgi:hypothetical protein
MNLFIVYIDHLKGNDPGLKFYIDTFSASDQIFVQDNSPRIAS